MKKLLMYLIAFFSFFVLIDSVNASASLKMECDKSSLDEGKSARCYLKLVTDQEQATEVRYSVTSEAMSLSEISMHNGMSSGSSYSTSEEGTFKNGSVVGAFTITVPKKFLAMDYPIKITNIKISNNYNQLNEETTYTPTIKINGSIPFNGPAGAALEFECPNYYVNTSVTCDLILNVKNTYFNSVSFYTENGPLYYKESDYQSHGYFMNDESKPYYYIYHLTRETGNPFVGKSKLGTIKITPQKGNNKIIFKDVVVSNSNIYISGSYGTSGTSNEMNLGVFEFPYTGIERPVGLSSLKVDGVSVPNFSTDNYSYNVTVTNKSKVTISGTNLDSEGKCEGLGSFSIKEGNNTFKVKCYNPDNKDKKEYTININSVDDRSNIATLSSLSLDYGTINFNKDTTSYSLSVPGNVSSITISSTLTDSKSSYVSGYGNRKVNLKYGKNEILIKVQAEKGNTKEYKITIDRKDDRSKINTLSKLELSVGKIDFKPANNNYNLNVKKDVTEVTIYSELTDSKSSYVSGYGNRKVNLKYGKNEILIKVKAENESINTYKIVIYRDDNKSTVNTLKTLSLSSGEINFDPNKTDYKVNVDKDVYYVTISSTLTDPKSSYVSGYGNRKINLNHGNNKISIKVKAENEDIRTYTIEVYREEEQAIVTPKHEQDLSIKRIDTSNKLTRNEDGTFTVEISEKANTADLNVSLMDDQATYEIIGNENLKDGDIVIVRVTSEDKTETKEYSILIKKVSSDDKLSIPMPVIIGGAVVVVLAIGFFIVKSKPKYNY